MSNFTPASNIISESGLLSPPTSAIKSQSRNETPFWISAPNYEFYNSFLSPTRSKNTALSSSSSPKVLPLHIEKDTTTKPKKHFHWYILATSMIFSLISLHKIEFIFPATCLFVAFIYLWIRETHK